MKRCSGCGRVMPLSSKDTEGLHNEPTGAQASTLVDIVQMARTIGRVPTVAALAALAGVSQNAIHSRREGLIRRGLLRRVDGRHIEVTAAGRQVVEELERLSRKEAAS